MFILVSIVYIARFSFSTPPPSNYVLTRSGALALSSKKSSLPLPHAFALAHKIRHDSRSYRTERIDKVIERQKAATRERGREEYTYEHIKYEPVVCEPYPIAATIKRHWFSGALLRASHPVRGKSYASRNLVVVVVIVAVVVVLVVACKCTSVFTEQP